MNKAQIIGNLGKDPDVRTMQNGDRVCSITVATSDRWKDKATGERKERTEWHRVSIFNPNLIDIAEKYLRQGSKVFIQGEIRTRKWQDQGGQDRYTTEIVLGRFKGEIEMLDSAPGKDNTAATQAPPEATQPPADASNFDLDDEIPF